MNSNCTSFTNCGKIYLVTSIVCIAPQYAVVHIYLMHISVYLYKCNVIKYACSHITFLLYLSTSTFFYFIILFHYSYSITVLKSRSQKIKVSRIFMKNYQCNII